MAARIRQLYREMGEPREFTWVELGAGRRKWPSVLGVGVHPIDIDSGNLPEKFRGVVFSNEFFDACRWRWLCTAMARSASSAWRSKTGGSDGGQAARCAKKWSITCTAGSLRRKKADGTKPNLEALGWMERIGRALESGYALTVDYGYTRAESVRFPAGTLMAYRRHMAREDVLEDPGERDITAHVNFTALEESGAACGLRKERFETLARTILTAGEADQFAAR